MSRKAIHHSIFLYASVLLAVLLPFGKLLPIPIILLFLNWIIEGDFYAKWLQLKQQKVGWILPVFYILHIVG